ncbi:MAG: hypothetical protein JSU90_09080 [Nitrospiraceae bacterium]|nr:MAG: hypothetical protein JSU90_09080 [Nitrospiraceae bacterium]
MVVFDDVIAANTSARLRALTKGLFFPTGGQLVTFVVDGREIGTTLSGGDGYAFHRYTPRGTGVFPLEARAGDEMDTGTIIVMGAGDRLILVEIESALLEPSLALAPRQDSNPALRKLSQDSRVLYLTTLMGVPRARAWLADHEFPLSAVMKWEGGRFLDRCREDGIDVSAIIASPAVLDEAQGVSDRFSFQATDSGEKTGGWNKLLEQLQNRKNGP